MAHWMRRWIGAGTLLVMGACVPQASIGSGGSQPPAAASAEPPARRSLDAVPVDAASEAATGPAGASQTGADRAAGAAGSGRSAHLRLIPQLGHKKYVKSVAYSPSGDLVLSGDEALLLWDVRTGLLVRRLEGRLFNTITGIAWLPDGRRALTASRNGVMRLWDLESGSQVRAFGDSRVAVEALAVSRDGRTAASGGSNGDISIWNIEDGSLRATLRGHAERITTVAFSPDSKRLASAAEDDTMRAWDIAAGSALWTIKPERKLWILFGDGTRKWTGKNAKLRVASLAYSPDGRWLATGDDGGAKVWSAQTGELTRELDSVDGAVSPIVWSADGATLAGGRLKSIALWAPGSGKLLGTLEGHLGGINALAFSSDSARIVSGAADAAVRLWDVPTRTPHLTFAGHAGQIQTVALSRDGRLALSGGGALEASASDTALHLWDVRSGAHLRTLVGNKEIVHAAVFAADGKTAVSAAGDDVTVWDLERGEPVLTMGDPSAGGGRYVRGAMLGVKSLALLPDGRSVAGACGDKIVRIWDLRTGRVVRRVAPHKEPISAIVLSPDGKLLASGGWDSTVHVWDLAADRELHALTGHTKWVSSLAFSGDGKRLLSGGLDATIRLWDVDAGKALAVVSTGAAVDSVALSSDGRLAVCDGERDVAVWDLATKTRIQKLEGHGADVHAVALSGDGRFVLSGGDDGTMRLWRADGSASMAMVADGSEWLLYDDAGRFDASRGGGGLVAAVEGLKSHRIDQLAIRNNRPDEILAPLGLAPRSLIEHFRARHERRLTKLGLDAGALAGRFDEAPTARIVDVATRGAEADVTVELAGRHADLLRLNLYANGVPLLGALGKPVSGRSQRVTERVELAAGPNRIEAAVLDARGAESLRDVRVLTRPGAARGDLYFLGFGVSRYRDARLDLRFAHKDVLDLAAALRAAQGGDGYQRVFVRTYIDDQVTARTIDASRSFLEPAKVDDTVVLMVAGHGVYTRDAEASYYFATHDVDVRRIAETAAKFESLESLLQGIRPRRKLFLLDTCESGEREDTSGASPAAAGARGLTARTARALVLEASAAASPRASRLGRERYIYNDLERRSGAVVFSSSFGDEASYEIEGEQNGAFTRAILEALTSPSADTSRDRRVSLAELRAYVTPTVAKRTGGLQHPVVDRDNPDLALWLPVVDAPLMGRLDAPGDASPSPPPDGIEALRLPPGAGGCGCALAGSTDRAGAGGGLFFTALALLGMRRRRRRAS